MSNGKSSWKRNALAMGGLLVIGLVGGAIGGAMGAWRTVCYDCPSVAQLYTWEPRQSTKILSRDGETVAELALERRTPVDIDSLPGHVPQAFIAIEDKRFYRHGGYDLMGYARAIRNQLLGGSGGGSTITLQLARHMFIEEVGFDQSLRRKLRELHVAVDLEQVYEKDQILEAYINQINYDNGWYGIESAAQNYFGKHATELNPAEAATLAAVINLPAYYNPLKHPERARQRRNLVLSLMADQGYLERDEAARWRQEPLPESRSRMGASETAPYFVEWVRRILEDRFGRDLYSGGYRVYTSLDVGMQQRAREAMEKGWARVESQPNYRHPTYADLRGDTASSGPRDTGYLQGMFVAMDPRTGEVKALIGGRDFDDSKFNRATQARRQPGSVFKPFAYTAAIAGGIPASHTILDAPVNVDLPDGTVWSPRNFGGNFDGEITLRDALRRSVNVPAVKIGMEVGLETVAQYAKRMGISGDIPRVPSLPIGVPAVLPIDVAEAYTTFANLGIKVEPRPILRVEDSRGRVVWKTEPEQERVIEPEVAYIMVDMLKDVVNSGSAYSVRDPSRGNVPVALPAAGKTGTTNDGTDVWFAGFTPDLLAVAWLGFDRPASILPNAAGGTFAAPIWADFVRPLYAQRELPADWERPDRLRTAMIDRESGKLFSEDFCPTELMAEEIYLPGTEPTELCDLHSPGLFGAPLRGFEQVLPEQGDTMPTDTVGTPR